MIEVGTLLKHKTSGDFGTVTAKYTKVIRDDSDWEAMRYGGGDYATVATVVDILYHNGHKRSGLTYSKARKFYEVISKEK